MQVISVEELVKYQKENVIIDSFEAVPMSVIDDIKAEIEQIRKEDMECDGCSDMGMVLDIIDKHTKGDMENEL